MSLNPLGVLDLSLVTGRLIDMLTDCIDASPLWATVDPGTPHPKVSGDMPDITRKDQFILSVCLIHVSADKFQRNFVAVPGPLPPPVPPPPPQRALKIPAQPLSLDLFYLVTAFDPGGSGSYVHEQQAMSIALKCFHENPIVRATVPISPTQTVKEEFTLTMEIQTNDEVARLWDSITVPYRLSVFYKVSVVFLTPPDPPATAKQAVRFTLAVDPASLPFAFSGQLVGTSSTATFTSPNSTTANPEIVTNNYSPAVVTPSQFLTVYGAGLKPNAALPKVYLLVPPDYQPPQEVTSWNQDGPPDMQTDSRIVLKLPDTIGPGQAPPPGIYQVLAGSAANPSNRTNATPFSIAARVDVTTVPPNPPILVGGPPYTVKGMGFIVNQTQVLLETVALTEVSGVPGAGQFNIAAVDTLVFAPPALSPGPYALRIRVNQVESPPSWWVHV